jgi:hypothetical protein
MVFAVHDQSDVIEIVNQFVDFDHAVVGIKTGGGLLMATKQDNGAAGRGRKEAPSPNSRWRFDLNTLFMSILTLLMGGLYLSIDGRFDSVNGRIDSINDRINDLSTRVDRLEQRLDERLDRLEQRIDASSQTLQTLFLDYINKQAGGASARDGIVTTFANLAEAEKLMTPALKATLDTLSFGNKAYSEFQLRSKLIQYVNPSDILQAAQVKKVALYKIHLAMAAYYYHKHKPQP